MVGMGYDLHRLVQGKKLILGGVPIESENGTIAHSDGDVLIHSLVDAILGAAGLGDIGEHFPDTYPEYKDADSSIFIEEAMRLLKKNNFSITNIDATIILEKPKLSQYKNIIRQNIARFCKISVDRVNIKAKTGEKIGVIGNKEAIAAMCVCEIQQDK
jgi:2-C-methyl-D-erythritol 2,4-cyclodiphosphate synthase